MKVCYFIQFNQKEWHKFIFLEYNMIHEFQPSYPENSEIKCLLKIAMEKAMAPHSSTLAWKIPWTEEPGRLQSMGLLRVEHD